MSGFLLREGRREEDLVAKTLLVLAVEEKFFAF